MKKNILRLLASVCLLMGWVLNAMAQSVGPTSALMPLPNNIQLQASQPDFQWTPQTVFRTSLPADAFCVGELQRIWKERMGVELPLADAAAKKAKSVVELNLTSTIEGPEHYRLEVSKQAVRLSASTEAGLFYALQTLDQVLLGDVCRTSRRQVAALCIDDAPRFARRALMIDPSRHFLPVNDVKFYIDQMARYKYNVLQLHLTDDQGWRIEIKQHPNLTRIGAFRNPKGGDQGPDNGFYTQEQLKDLIAYAAQRHVEIVPELDIPGHTVAVLAAYPELGCSHTQGEPKEMGKTVNQMLCAHNPQVYTLYDDIIREVAALFPSSQIHLGGDEAVIEQNWGKCTHCQALMKELGYQQEAQLMNYFFDRMLASVRKYGKQPVLWCELDNIYPPANGYLFDYPKDVTLVTWRNGLTPKCIELTRQHGNPLLMAPGEYAYLDYPQLKGDLPEFNNWGMPVTTLEKCYEFDPGYGLPAADQAHIVGVMGTLWGEAMKDIHRVTYMTYPRGFALAEAAWTQMEHRSWPSFCERMYPNLLNLMKHGVSVRVPFEVVKRQPAEK